MAPRFAWSTPKTASAFLIGPRVPLATISIARTAEIATSEGGVCRSNEALFAARKLAMYGSTVGGATVANGGGLLADGEGGTTAGDGALHPIARQTRTTAKRAVDRP